MYDLAIIQMLGLGSVVYIIYAGGLSTCTPILVWGWSARLYTYTLCFASQLSFGENKLMNGQWLSRVKLDLIGYPKHKYVSI